MAVTLFTDVYATVAQCDLRLPNNKRWTALTTAQKEEVLKAAAASIDDIAAWSGEKDDSGQAMEFPRDFSAPTDHPIFSTAAQTQRLRAATIAQLAHSLSMRDWGQGDFSQSEPGRIYPTAGASIGPEAAGILSPYLLHP